MTASDLKSGLAMLVGALTNAGVTVTVTILSASGLRPTGLHTAGDTTATLILSAM